MKEFMINLENRIEELGKEKAHAHALMYHFNGVSAVGYAMAKQAYKDATVELHKLCEIADTLNDMGDTLNKAYFGNN